MENFGLVLLIAAIAFWLGRRSKTQAPVFPDLCNSSSSQAPEGLSAEDGVPMTLQRAATLVFTCGWLIAWTAGVLMALATFLRNIGANFETMFIGGWLIAAIAGWFFAARIVCRLASGKPIGTRGGRMP